MFGPLKRMETVPEQIAGILRRAIFVGELPVGEKLPSEKALATQFETNRVSLRQALQILKVDDLIEGGQGRAWRVADFRRQSGLKWLPEWVEAQGLTEETLALIQDFLAIRTPILRQVLVAATERRSEAQMDVLSERLEQLERLVREEANSEAILQADLAWFEALLDASNSLLYRSVYQPFSAIYRRVTKYIAQMWQPPPTYPSALREVLDAMVEGDAPRAERHMVAYLEDESQRLSAVLG